MPFDGADFAVSPTAIVLRALREALIRNGWCKQVYRWGPRRCLSSALRVARRDTGCPTRMARRYLRRAICEHTNHTWGIVQFNDRWDTTFDDVQAVVTRAIRLADQEALTA